MTQGLELCLVAEHGEQDRHKRDQEEMGDSLIYVGYETRRRKHSRLASCRRHSPMQAGTTLRDNATFNRYGLDFWVQTMRGLRHTISHFCNEGSAMRSTLQCVVLVVTRLSFGQG